MDVSYLFILLSLSVSTHSHRILLLFYILTQAQFYMQWRASVASTFFASLPNERVCVCVWGVAIPSVETTAIPTTTNVPTITDDHSFQKIVYIFLLCFYFYFGKATFGGRHRSFDFLGLLSGDLQSDVYRGMSVRVRQIVRRMSTILAYIFFQRSKLMCAGWRKC